MDALPTTQLPITTVSGSSTDTLTTLASLGNFAQNSPGMQTPPFALLLSQLSFEQPLDDPAAPLDGNLITQLMAEPGSETLPVTGNILPLQLSDAPVEAEVLPLVAATATTEQAVVTALPLPTVTQPGLPTAIKADFAGVRLTGATREPQPVGPVMNADGEPAQLVSTRAAPTLSASADNVATAATVAADELIEFELPEQFVRQQPGLSASPTPTVGIAGPGPAAPLTQATAPATPATSFLLEQPVADPNWGDELGQRLVWMTEQGVGRAQLRMNPPELGPVEVRISVANDEARVAFNVQHGATREALEAAMPRLREMFASQGLNLADANVSEQSAGEQQQAGNSSQHDGDDHTGTSFERFNGEAADPLAEAPPDHAVESQVHSIIDAYA